MITLLTIQRKTYFNNFLYRAIGNGKSNITALYIANPSTNPIKYKSSSASGGMFGLNQYVLLSG